MAGVTTASRAGWGVIASSEAMNPDPGNGYVQGASFSNNYTISNIPTSEWRDAEISFCFGNQSTWVTNMGFYFNGTTAPMHSSYNYWGWSTGSSFGTNYQTDAYIYPIQFSSYGFTCRLYISNYSSTSNIKTYSFDWHYSIGHATSYATTGRGVGQWRSSDPITSITFTEPYNNGSIAYQGYLITGRNPK